MAGTWVEAGLGNQILTFSEEHPKMFAETRALGFRVFQQPEGFEDSLITCWRIPQPPRKHGQTMACRDLFTRALSKKARNQSFLCQQLCNSARGEVPSVILTAHCVVNRPVKVKTAQKHLRLRTEFLQLGELRDTRVLREGFFAFRPMRKQE